MTITEIIKRSMACGASSSMLAGAIVSIIAAELRKQGEKANTYDKQDQWEAAAKLVEDME